MREKIQNRKPVFGTMLNEVFFPNITYILKNCGYDFLIIDCEHGSLDYSQVASIISVARLTGVSTIVRIPEIRRECITKYLDMGADGLLVPMVASAEDAARVVNFAKYKPIGNRGISINRAHSMYNPGDMNDYLKKANAGTMLFVQIELASALEDVDSIAATCGLDGLIVGPSDLSMDMGIFNQLSHPNLLDAVNKVAQSAKRNGLSSGIITGDRALIKSCRDYGMNVICCDSETRILCEGLKNNLAELSLDNAILKDVNSKNW